MMEELIQAIIEPFASSIDHPGTEARVWAARITECWRSSVEGILRTGRLLVEAKTTLPHGEFGHMIENDLPFGERTAQRLMAIGQDIRLSNPTHVSLLPASWGTLYELTKLSDEEFTSAVEQHVIRPDMLRGEAELIRPLTHRQPQESQSESNQRQNGYGTEGAQADGVVSRPDVGRSTSATSERMDATAGETAPHSMMPSGGLAIAHPRIEPSDSLDFFPTPPWATRALFEHVLHHLERRSHCQYQVAWEPACGEGHMAEVMREYFRHVLATDVADYDYGDGTVDFLKYTKEHLGAQAYDWIITNPPFNDSAEFVPKAIDLAGTGVAMFVRLSWLESVGRYEKIFRDKPPTLLAIFTERVPLHKGRWEQDGGTMTAYIWLVWVKGAEPRAPFWIPPGCRVALSKPEDIERFGKSVVEGEAA